MESPGDGVTLDPNEEKGSTEQTIYPKDPCRYVLRKLVKL